MNNLNIKKISMSLVIASLVSSTAFANTDKVDALIKKSEIAVPTFSELVKQYDVNKDDMLNAQELVEHVNLVKVFDVIDVNKDNEINSDEYTKYVDSLKAKV